MASATDLLMIYMAIELVSMVSYVLAGYSKGDREAAEASLKYVIYGGVASGVMLFGMSYLYGLLGTTDLTRFAAAIAAGPLHPAATGSGSSWRWCWSPPASATRSPRCPGTCGAPTSTRAPPPPSPPSSRSAPRRPASRWRRACSGARSTCAAPMTGGSRVPVGNIPWPAVVGVLSAVTMTLGNLTALPQTNLKRLLAYSSIAHAGYVLMGLAANSFVGTQAIMIYMLVYLIMNLGAFLVVIVVERFTGSPTILEFRGLGHRAPLAAVSMAVFLFSLTGLPPFIGFTGKYWLFVAVLDRVSGPAGTWYAVLAIIAALNTAVSLYYYVRVLRAMFIEAPLSKIELTYPASYKWLLAGFATATVLFGIWVTPIMDWTRLSLGQFYRG